MTLRESKGYCCSRMATDLISTCAQHPNRFDCPDALIYATEDKRYGIIVHDGGNSYVAISHCPWCGAGLSRSPESAA